MPLMIAAKYWAGIGLEKRTIAVLASAASAPARSRIAGAIAYLRHSSVMLNRTSSTVSGSPPPQVAVRVPPRLGDSWARADPKPSATPARQPAVNARRNMRPLDIPASLSLSRDHANFGPDRC